jgi:hypothetical protein
VRLIDRLRVLRAVQAILLIAGAAWLFAAGHPGLAAGLLVSVVLRGGLTVYARRVTARTLAAPFRTERAGRLEAAVPEGWYAHGTDDGFYLADDDVKISVTWHAKSPEFVQTVDLERIAAGLVDMLAKGRKQHDVESCTARFLGVETRGRRATFAGWELTAIEAYAVRVPAESAIVSVTISGPESGPRALIRRCLEGFALTGGTGGERA